MNRGRSLTIFLLSALFLGLGSAISHADLPPVATDARVAGDANRTRFVADLSKKVKLSAFILANPYRVIVDLPETRFKFDSKKGKSGRGLISAWRYGLFAPGKSRIVLDLTGPAKIEKAFVLPASGDQPARLVVDMAKTSLAAFRSRQARERLERRKAGSVARLNDTTIVKKRKGKGARPTVVIDPGHGGIDSGATGRKGTIEKDIVLAFAKILKEKLQASDRYDVLLTRETDRFLTLNNRVVFARSHGADLFISVHADSVRQKWVRGATVYTQSEKASDSVAHEIAIAENKSDIIAGVELENEPPVVSDILIDLTRRETKNFSIHFARTLVVSMKTAGRLNKNPHRSAGFRVLRAHDVPSVLLELGYLSNSKDEKLLVDIEWQKKMADSVSAAVTEFFRMRIARGID